MQSTSLLTSKWVLQPSDASAPCTVCEVIWVLQNKTKHTHLAPASHRDLQSLALPLKSFHPAASACYSPALSHLPREWLCSFPLLTQQSAPVLIIHFISPAEPRAWETYLIPNGQVMHSRVNIGLEINNFGWIRPGSLLNWSDAFAALISQGISILAFLQTTSTLFGRVVCRIVHMLIMSDTARFLEGITSEQSPSTVLFFF